MFTRRHFDQTRNCHRKSKSTGVITLSDRILRLIARDTHFFLSTFLFTFINFIHLSRKDSVMRVYSFAVKQKLISREQKQTTCYSHSLIISPSLSLSLTHSLSLSFSLKSMDMRCVGCSTAAADFRSDKCQQGHCFLENRFKFATRTHLRETITRLKKS